VSRKKPNYETMNATARRNRKDSNDKTVQLNRIFVRDNGICQICFNPCRRDEASREHIKELQFCTKEEARSDDNMVLAHINCNNDRAKKPKSKTRVINPTRPRLTYTIEEAFPDFKDWQGFDS